MSEPGTGGAGAPAGGERRPRHRRPLGSLRWGIGLVSGLALLAVLAPLVAPYDPYAQVDPRAAALRPPGTVLAAVHLAGGGWLLADRARRTPDGLEIERLGEHRLLPASRVANLSSAGVADRRVYLLGTDQFGRDLLSRLIYGARISLSVGLFAVLLALTVGVAVGALAALGGPLLDAVLMRTVDALLAFPVLFLLVALAALLRPGTAGTTAILGATTWMAISRLTRAELRGVARRGFVLAARGLGQHPLAVLFRHLLPNAMTPVLVQSTLQIGSLILLESTLSFLGLGIQPPVPSWGNMLSDARHAPLEAWWLAVFPGAALALAAIAWNLLGDELRDALDPRWRGPELAAAPGSLAADAGGIGPAGQ